jgi:hypothetical protein
MGVKSFKLGVSICLFILFPFIFLLVKSDRPNAAADGVYVKNTEPNQGGLCAQKNPAHEPKWFTL